MCLAHWTISQRTIHTVLPIKTEAYRYEKPNPASTLGDAIRAARQKAGLTREQFSKMVGVPVYWLGRWERNRSHPSKMQWRGLAEALHLEWPQKLKHDDCAVSVVPTACENLTEFEFVICSPAKLPPIKTVGLDWSAYRDGAW
jgi:DNA-binding transcriptional regulator YiaG